MFTACLPYKITGLSILALALIEVGCDTTPTRHPASGSHVDASMHVASTPDAGAHDAGALGPTPSDAGPNADAIFVHQADFPQLSTGCVVDSAPSTNVLTKGTLDLAFSLRYATAFVVGFTAPGTSGTFTRIVLDQTDVQVTDENGQQVVAPYQVVTPGIVDATAGGAVGYGLVQVTLIPPDFSSTLMNALKSGGAEQHFLSSIRVHGHSLEGAAFVSSAFELPIDICYGCLVSFPAEANDPQAAVQPNCGLGSFDSHQPCVLGQDEPVDCRLCNNLIPDSGLCEPPPTVPAPDGGM